jgi:hypothetical protein
MEIVTLSTNNKEDFKSLKLEILRFLAFRRMAESQESDEVFIKRKENGKHPNRFTIQIPNENLNFLHYPVYNRSVVSATLPRENFTLSDTFYSLFEENMSTGLCRLNNSQKEVHISLLKHFWLDSSVTFQVFYNILLAPLNNKQWITQSDFLRSIEATHSKNMCRAFIPEKNERKFSSGMRIQQFLCD